MSRVYEHVMKGWDKTNEKELLPYFNRHNELTISQGCLLWGIRLVVPQEYRQQTLELFCTPRRGKNEITRQRLCLVTKHRLGYRGTCKTLYRMSKTSSESELSTVTSIGMAVDAMEKNSHRLCRTIHG